ncbi:MAG: hypothetical protein COT74_10400 [Bdellovibrionales bacterium CG10_big_fil_rev_8_21_14_0_10_45_34]|nr:MAG: hypothetical protein COT74_10400 [Bdellovibrionales bacterium CG10_big_fil_rev_8_21_14_0_10_45_34]
MKQIKLQKAFDMSFLVIVTAYGLMIVSLFYWVFERFESEMYSRVKAELILIADSQIPYLIEDFNSESHQSVHLRSLGLTANYRDLKLAIRVKDQQGKVWSEEPLNLVSNYADLSESKKVYVVKDITYFPDTLGHVEIWATPPDTLLAKNNALIWSFLVGIIALVLGLFLHRKFLHVFALKPLLQLKHSVRNYKYGGSFSLPTTGSVDIAELGNEFSTLLKKVEDADSREKISEMKSQIARQIAHDIRSPVSVLKSVFTTDNSELPQSKELISKALYRIESIANDLLYRTVDLQIVSAEEIADLIQSVVEEKNIEFDHQISLLSDFRPGPAKVRMSKSHFSRIVSNLVNNSAQAKKNSLVKIVVSLNVVNEEVVVAISDDGVGIPEDTIRRVIQGDQVISESGFGLGLSSARNQILAWDAKFTIERLKDAGTKVEIRFPRQDINPTGATAF